MCWPPECAPENDLRDLFFLPATQVQAIVEALQFLPEQTLRARFEARKMLPLYSQSEVWDEANWTFWLRALFYLKNFFEPAAAHQQFVLTWRN